MSATTSLESAHFAIQAKVKFSRLSQLSSDTTHTLNANFHEAWRVDAIVPKAPHTHEETGLGVFIYAPPKSVNATLGGGNGIEVVLSLATLKGEVQATNSFRWEGDDAGMGYASLVDWNKFWHKNANHRDDDGFYISIEIYSRTYIRPVVYGPCMLKTILHLTQGEDLFDTKFLLFSRPRGDGNVHGAQDPLPVFASSAFLQDQCDYFNTSVFYLSYTMSRSDF